MPEDKSYTGFVNLIDVKKILIERPLSAEYIYYAFKKLGENTETDGHSVFLGQVRADKIEGKTVKAIEYSAYEAMVGNEAQKIIDTVRSEFSDVK